MMATSPGSIVNKKPPSPAPEDVSRGSQVPPPPPNLQNKPPLTPGKKRSLKPKKKKSKAKKVAPAQTAASSSKDEPVPVPPKDAKTQETQTEEGQNREGVLEMFHRRGYFVPLFWCQPWWLRFSCRVFAVLHILFAIYTLHNIIAFKKAVTFCSDLNTDTECIKNGTTNGGAYKCDDIKFLCKNYKIAMAADVAITFLAHAAAGVLLMVASCHHIAMLFLIVIGLMFLQAIVQTIITVGFRFPVVDKGIELGLYDSVHVSGQTEKERKKFRKHVHLFFYVRIAISFGWAIGLSLLYFSYHQVMRHDDDLFLDIVPDEVDEVPPETPATPSYPLGSAEARAGEAMPHETDLA